MKQENKKYMVIKDTAEHEKGYIIETDDKHQQEYFEANPYYYKPNQPTSEVDRITKLMPRSGKCNKCTLDNEHCNGLEMGCGCECVPTNEEKKWKKHPAHGMLDEGSNCFWQKEIVDGVYAEIIEWEHEKGVKTYALKSQISEEYCITGVTTNIESFKYDKLDFGLIEKDAITIINKLINYKNDQ